MSDLAGVDIGWHRDPTRIESIRDALAAEKRWGQKTKAGFYDYDDKRNPRPAPAWRKSLRISARRPAPRSTK
jgi:3-hydroxyacyl-CoA dehydrogenase